MTLDDIYKKFKTNTKKLGLKQATEILNQDEANYYNELNEKERLNGEFN